MLSADQQAVLAQLDIPQWQVRQVSKQKVLKLSQTDYTQRQAMLAPLLANIGFFMGVSDIHFVEEDQAKPNQEVVFDATVLPFSLHDVLSQPQLKSQLLAMLREPACLDA